MPIENENSTEDKIRIVAEKAAEIIGGDITTERVKKVIELSNQHGHIIHGIKDNKNFPEVQKSGIKPLTPEGNFASYWTSGTRIFLNESIPGTFTTYDTGLLHYGHSSDPKDKHHRHMTIAITNKNLLPPAEAIKINGNDYIQLHTAITRDKIALLRVTIAHHDSKLSHRALGQIAEQEIFELLEESFVKGYQPGSLVVR